MVKEKPHYTEKYKIAYTGFVALAFALGVFLGPFLLFGGDIGSKRASELVKSIYEKNSGIPLTIVSESDFGPFYKIVLKSGANKDLGPQFIETYVTKNGRYIIENPIEVAAFNNFIERKLEFSNCLKSSGLKFYGDSTIEIVKKQISALGGARYVSSFYNPLDNSTLQYLLSHNVTLVPAFEFRGIFYEGYKDLPWFENLTGCKY